ncbi:MAG: ABC transporter permease [Armatimonadetes bacterium]|nr:ABC transporter permease [Armatimonadota bacterium]
MLEFLDATIKLSVPLLFAALGETVTERSGVLNIGVEGVMLTSAFFGFWVALATGNTSLGIAAGVGSALAMTLLFGWLTVKIPADQIVVGMGINLLAVGLTGALYRILFGETGSALTVTTLPPAPLPLLSDLPLIGPVFFRQNLLVYLSFACVPALAFLFYRTGAGLSLRAVGEDPKAADTAGVPVHRVRLAAVLAGGGLAGLGGAFLSLAHAHTFTEGMTAGRGFIALAIVILGRWSPWGALGASLLFGAASALQFTLQSQGFQAPYPFFLALPYVVTLAVLMGVRGTARAPAALARPYERE